MAGDDGRCGVAVAVVLRAGRQNNQDFSAKQRARTPCRSIADRPKSAVDRRFPPAEALGGLIFAI